MATSARFGPPFRAEHIGSFLRPPALLAARADHSQGRIGAAELRAGSFAPLAAVPDHKTVVLGLVSTKQATLESADDIKRRIEEASAYVDFDRLAISPQCGFASLYTGNPITFEDQANKLRLIVEVAQDLWGYTPAAAG
jgi:methionine synthase II (cobalamin-independent)